MLFGWVDHARLPNGQTLTFGRRIKREVLDALARVEPAVPADVRRDLTGTGIRNGRVRGEKKDLMQEVVRLAGDRARWRAFIHSGAKFRREKKGGGG